MKKDIEKYELIEKYLKNELEGNELTEFRKKLSSDTEFSAEVKHHEELFHVLIDSSLLDVKKQIRKIHRQNSSIFRKNRTGRNILYFIAAGILLLSISVIVHIISVKDKKSSGEKNKPAPISNVENTNHLNPVSNSNIVEKNSMQKMVVKAETDTLFNNKTAGISMKSANNTSLIGDSLNEKVNHEGDTEIKASADTAEKKPVLGKVEKTDKKENSYDCSNTKISAIIETEESCDNKPTGKLSIDKNLIEGGDSPYTISIDGGKTYHKSYIFKNLYSASYAVYIKDIHNCITKIGSYWIESISCSLADKFAPGKGEVWKIPNQNTSGRLRIYNTSGKLVYEKNINYEGEHEWDGRSGSGEALPMGAYSFILELDGGDNVTGTVTIIR